MRGSLARWSGARVRRGWFDQICGREKAPEGRAHSKTLARSPKALNKRASVWSAVASAPLSSERRILRTRWRVARARAAVNAPHSRRFARFEAAACATFFSSDSNHSVLWEGLRQNLALLNQNPIKSTPCPDLLISPTTARRPREIHARPARLYQST